MALEDVEFTAGTALLLVGHGYLGWFGGIWIFCIMSRFI